MAEIVRAGIISSRGQTEAAAIIGMTRLSSCATYPSQAMRLILPPTGNEAISMLKSSALV